MRIDPRTLGYALAFLSAAAGAARYNCAVFAKGDGISYIPFLALSLVVGVLCSAVHVTVRDGAKGFVPLRGRWRSALLYGTLMAITTLCHFLALHYLNETVMTSLSQTGILITVALAVWLLGERFTRTEWLATAVICGGVFLFRPWEAVRLKGFLVIMAGVWAGALATIGAKRWVQGVPPRTLMLWRNVVALAVVGTYASFLPAPRLTAAGAAAVVAAGVLGPYLHGLFFLQSLERIEAAKASLTSRIQPAIVFLLSWLLLGRHPGGQDLVSAAVLVAGTLWLALARPRSP